MTATDRALCELLTVEEGGMAPLRTSAGGGDLFRQLLAAKLVKPEPSSGRYVLTKVGRERAVAARAQARTGSVGASALRGVR